jgi:hypothetical protein
MKTGCSMAETSNKDYGLKRAVLPMMMILWERFLIGERFSYSDFLTGYF